jgi:predicted chitinase
MIPTLTREDLIAICPPPKSGLRREVWEGYVKAMTSAQAKKLFEKYEINTPLRLSHLLATWVAETNLCILWESGAYSATSIVRVFGVGRHSAAITLGEARRIALLPVAKRTEVLFERVYGLGNKRKARELGNTEPGDGYRFRGLGLNQITGRWAHEKSAKEIGCKLEDLEKPINCIHAALLEWQRKGCNAHADRDDVVAVRKLINAGSLKVSVHRINGLDNAKAALARAKRVIGPDDFDDEVDLPPPLPDDAIMLRDATVQDLRSASKTVRVLARVRAFIVFCVVSIGGLINAENLDVAKDWVQDLQGLVFSNLLWIGGAVAVGVWLLAKWLEHRRAEELAEGRYIPSGALAGPREADDPDLAPASAG